MSGAFKPGTAIRGTTLRKVNEVDVITCMVRRDSLKAAPWNPIKRTELRNLTPLRESMEQYGFFAHQPIIVANDATIVDGHRRWTVAGILQIEEVPVSIVDMEPGELWAVINGTRLDVTGAQALEAYARGLTQRPPKLARMMDRLESIVGAEGMIELGQRGVSPHIAHQAKRIGNYCGYGDDVDFLRMTVWWLVNNRQMNIITSRAIKEEIDPATIELAIRQGKPLRLTLMASA